MSAETKLGEYTINETEEKLIRTAFRTLTREVVGHCEQAGWRDQPPSVEEEAAAFAKVLEREDLTEAGLVSFLAAFKERHKPRTDGDTSMLLVSEIAEGFEGMRAKPKTIIERDTPDGGVVACNGMPPVRGYNASAKIGPEFNCVEEEWADAIIRKVDEADRRGLDLIGAMFAKMRFNRRRSFRHGGKKL